MFTKEKLSEAKALIKHKQYAEARSILHRIDHPLADKWLVRLDELDPPKKPFNARKWLAVAVVFLVFMVACYVLVIAPQIERVNEIGEQACIDAGLVCD